jgi:cell division protein FtsB
MVMRKFGRILNVLRNKYIASIIIFVVWILFFDRNDLWTQWDRRSELQKLETSKSFYEKEITSTRKDLMELNDNPAIIEKFAREKFYLKKANEQIFIIDDSVAEKK